MQKQPVPGFLFSEALRPYNDRFTGQIHTYRVDPAVLPINHTEHVGVGHTVLAAKSAVDNDRSHFLIHNIDPVRNVILPKSPAGSRAGEMRASVRIDIEHSCASRKEKQHQDFSQKPKSWFGPGHRFSVMAGENSLVRNAG